MSLLNEMLNDLNKQDRQRNVSSVGIPTSKQSLSAMNYFLRGAVLVISATSIISMGIFAFKSSHKKINSVEVVKVNKPYFASFMPPHPLFFENKPSLKKQKITQKKLVKTIKHKQIISSEKKTEKKSVEKIFLPLTLAQRLAHDYQKASTLMAIGEYKAAEKILRLVLAKKNEFLPARELLARLYLQQNRLGDAKMIITQGLALSPKAGGLLELNAKILIDEGRYQQALVILNRRSPHLKNEPDHYALLAHAYLQSGQAIKAGGIYHNLLQHFPLNGNYWLGYAVSLEQRGLAQQAAQAYKRVSQSQSSKPEVVGYALNRLQSLRA